MGLQPKRSNQHPNGNLKYNRYKNNSQIGVTITIIPHDVAVIHAYGRVDALKPTAGPTIAETYPDTPTPTLPNYHAVMRPYGTSADHDISSQNPINVRLPRPSKVAFTPCSYPCLSRPYIRDVKTDLKLVPHATYLLMRLIWSSLSHMPSCAVHTDDIQTTLDAATCRRHAVTYELAWVRRLFPEVLRRCCLSLTPNQTNANQLSGRSYCPCPLAAERMSTTTISNATPEIYLIIHAPDAMRMQARYAPSSLHMPTQQCASYDETPRKQTIPSEHAPHKFLLNTALWYRPTTLANIIDRQMDKEIGWTNLSIIRKSNDHTPLPTSSNNSGIMTNPPSIINQTHTSSRSSTALPLKTSDLENRLPETNPIHPSKNPATLNRPIITIYTISGFTATLKVQGIIDEHLRHNQYTANLL